MNVFKILVYAIVAIALLYVFLAYFAPMFRPSEDVFQIFSNNIDAAQANDGIAVLKEINYPQGFSMPASNFDSTRRNLIFICNSGSECCDEKSKSSLCNIQVEEKRITVLKNSNVKTYFRCAYENSIYNCKVYFGKKPAQLEINELATPKNNINIEQEPATAVFRLENTGEIDSLGVVARAEVKKETAPGEETLYKITESQKIGRILPGQNEQITIDLGIKDSGNYKVKLYAEGEDSGRPMKEFEFSTTGISTGDCKTAEKAEPELDGTQCNQRLNCTGCSAAFECKKAWGDAGETNIEMDSKDCALKTYPAENGNCRQS